MDPNNPSHVANATYKTGHPLIHLRDLFYVVVDLPESERDVWLAANVADPVERNTLRELLVAHQTQGFLETSAIELDSRIIAAEVKPEGLIGQQIGEFRITRALGQGGMAAVFLGERVGKDFTQRAAVKLLRRGLYSELEQRLFLRERQVLAALEHPHIARLIDGGVTGAGIPYLVMEYVDGVPITQYASGRNLSIRERLQLFAQVCDAVQAAHNNLIVHRDIKPSNILVTASGEVKLLDFGIAKLLEDENEGVTGTAGIFTPDYAAPEQIQGGAITTATDVYGLGALLHELLTGLRPSGMPTRRPSSLLDATTAPIHPQAPRTYPMSATQLRRILRGDLDNILLHALEAEPNRRYATAGAFADDIARYLDGRPVSAHPPTRWYRTSKFIQRHRGGVTVTAILVLAVFAALGLALWQAKIAKQEAQRANAQTTLAREQAQRAEAVRQFLFGLLDRAKPEENKGQPISAKSLLEKGEVQLKGNYADNPTLTADVSALLGLLYTNLSDFDRAQVLVDSALKTINDVSVPPDVRARVLFAASFLEFENDKYDVAIDHARQTLALLIDAAVPDPEIVARAHELIASSMVRRHESKFAATYLLEVMPQDRATLGENDAGVAQEWVTLGGAFSSLARFEESDAAFQHAIDIYKTKPGENISHLTQVLNELSVMLIHEGNYSRAEQTLRESLKIHEDIRDAGSHDEITVRANLVTALESQGRYPEALPQRLSLIEQGNKSGIWHPSDLSTLYGNVAVDYRELGRLAEAEMYARRSLSIADKSKISPEKALSQLATILTLQGRYSEAETVAGDAIAVVLKNGNQTPLSLAFHHSLIGEVHRLQHRLPQAMQDLQDSAAVLTDSIPITEPTRPMTLARLAAMQLDAGDIAAATATAQTAVSYARKALYGTQLAEPLFTLARAKLANGDATGAQAMLNETLALRAPLPATDMRVLETKTSLVYAFEFLGKKDQARVLRQEIEPVLKASKHPYATDLLKRLQM
jgi:tetratricopeptide (TPR) repeat protein